MATLTEQTELASWVDQSLDHLTGEWSAIPEAAAGWEAWEEFARLDLVLEWPLSEIRLHELLQLQS